MRNKISSLTLILILLQTIFFVETKAQIAIDPADKKVAPEQIMPDLKLTIGRYLDLADGLTADAAVKIALENNGEIRALRDELSASRSLIKQAGLRPNPRLEVGGNNRTFSRNVSAMATVMLPLELNGRRGARISVAEAEYKIRETQLANSERNLAAEVRLKFGESLAEIEKLKTLEEILANTEQGYKLIAGKVKEGRNAPLEENMSLVELNRMRSMREMSVANVEIKLLELKNLMGVDSAENLRLKGDFENLLLTVEPLTAAIEKALQTRPDLQAARENLRLAEARLAQSRREGKLDADVYLGYERTTMNMAMITNQNPVELENKMQTENMITFGVELMLPVRNKNQGAIEAAAFDIQAASKRLEFGELTVRREISTAYTRYERAVRSMTIYQAGVRNQARKNLEVVWQSYEFGGKDLLDYIAEERRFLDLENGYIDALLETYQAITEIRRAINSPDLIAK